MPKHPPFSKWPDDLPPVVPPRKPSGPGKTPFSCMRHSYEDYEPCPKCEADVITKLTRDRDELAAALEGWVSRGHMKSPACTCALCEDTRVLIARIKAGG
jgi:hypothetical protein